MMGVIIILIILKDVARSSTRVTRKQKSATDVLHYIQKKHVKNTYFAILQTEQTCKVTPAAHHVQHRKLINCNQ